MKNIIYFIIIIISISSCSTSEDTPIPGQNPSFNNPSDWLIDQSLVFDGGPGKDGIPSVDDPKFTRAREVDFLLEEDLILGLRVGDEVHAYPHPILDWHEIVNDEIGELKYALTYCPLTGTGIGWDRMINGQLTTYGVSGLLYESNLMPYDRATNSTWSQQRLECVNGQHIGKIPESISLVETTWDNWKDAFPDSKVLNRETGFDRNYRQYPYGDFKTNNSRIIFPVTNLDNRLPAKERVLGVIVDTFSIVFRIQALISGPELVSTQLGDKDLLVYNDGGRDILVTFEVDNPGDYSVISGVYPYIIQDTEGVRYDIFGYNDAGQQALLKPIQFFGYWFSWGTFYPDITIFKE